MLKDQEKSSNIDSVLYNKIPKNHILKLIHDHIDFSFINLLGAFFQWSRTVLCN